MPDPNTQAGLAGSPSWGLADGVVAVWAPGARSVALARPGRDDQALVAEGLGWHRAAAGLSPGERYGLRIDGLVVPDPASRSQPDGPGGWSEVVDPGSYAWSDAAWRGRPWHETVLYELHVGTFTPEGTFRAAIERLDHLARLGVTMIELMPIGEFEGRRNWGYDGVLPYAPYHGYGRPDDLKHLVDCCHARGIAVVLDVVYNHFGPAANWIAAYAPEFFTKRHATPWGEAVDFTERPVRDFFAENAVYWITEFHFDGLRLDAVQAVFDDGTPHILDEIAARARAASGGRHIHLMLENDKNDARWLERGRGAHYDAQWNDDFHHVMRVLLAGRVDGYYRDYAGAPLERLGTALAEGFSYQGEESTHRPGLIRGTKSGQLPPVAFVNFLQNHDQVGNTPFGQRLCALSPAAALRLGVAVLLLGPSIPMLFMGEEWAAEQPFDYFCDYDGPLADMVRTGRRSEFSHLPEFSDPAQLAKLPDPNAASTRDASVLDWSALDRPAHAAWLEFYRSLLAVRRERVVKLLPAIGGHAGRYRVLSTGGAVEMRWRLDDGRALTMAANFSDAPQPWAALDGETVFALVASAGALAAWDLRLVLSQAVG